MIIILLVSANGKIIIIARCIVVRRIAAENSYAYQAIAIFPIIIHGIDACERCMFVQKQLLKGVRCTTYDTFYTLFLHRNTYVAKHLALAIAAVSRI